MRDNPFESLPDIGGTRILAAAHMCGVTRQTFYNWIKAGRMPAPMRIGPNTSIIVNSELKAAGARLAEEASR